MARQMPEMALTVITPSIRILQTLMSRRSLHLVGLGAISPRPKSRSSGKPPHERYANMPLIRSFSPARGWSAIAACMRVRKPTPPCWKQMLLAARQTVALVDGSKLGRTGVARIGGLGELDCLVTERFVDPLLEKEMTWHNVSLQIA
ncbi:hypothetical protein LNQ52_25090 [Klebsiella pneumoniae subsp. pneumoniae]|nr:hypothetical protein [Klebsiella pneumoniae subsp. pneumoniae]